MKTLLAVLVGCSILVASNSVLAGCYSCGRPVSCGQSSPYMTECQCTDPNVKYIESGSNTCMSAAKYCEAFGNVGAR